MELFACSRGYSPHLAVREPHSAVYLGFPRPPVRPIRICCNIQTDAMRSEVFSFLLLLVLAHTFVSAGKYANPDHTGAVTPDVLEITGRGMMQINLH